MRKKRTKLKNRELPYYTKGEDIFNMVSHIIGATLGLTAMILCIIYAALRHNSWGVVASCFYGTSLIIHYTLSSIYHGLNENMGKKVLQVITHCTVYYMIACTYLPLLFCTVRPESPKLCWLGLLYICIICGTGIVLASIDIENYDKISMALYLIAGWSWLLIAKLLFRVLPKECMILIIIGGLIYTFGTTLYERGKIKKYAHSVFHILTVIASMIHFFAIVLYIV